MFSPAPKSFLILLSFNSPWQHSLPPLPPHRCRYTHPNTSPHPEIPHRHIVIYQAPEINDLWVRMRTAVSRQGVSEWVSVSTTVGITGVSQFSPTVIWRPLFRFIPSEETRGSHSSHLILHSPYPFVPGRCSRVLVGHSSAIREVSSCPARLSIPFLLHQYQFSFFFLLPFSFTHGFFSPYCPRIDKLFQGAN